MYCFFISLLLPPPKKMSGQSTVLSLVVSNVLHLYSTRGETFCSEYVCLFVGREKIVLALLFGSLSSVNQRNQESNLVSTLFRLVICSVYGLITAESMNNDHQNVNLLDHESTLYARICSTLMGVRSLRSHIIHFRFC